MPKEDDEPVVIDLPYNLVDIWQNNQNDKLTELESFLSNCEELVSLANRYQKDRWEVFSIDDVTVTSHDEDDQAIYTGSLEISYTRHQYNGCKDMNGEDDDYITATFEIHPQRLEIIIKGEPVPVERSTYEEF